MYGKEFEGENNQKGGQAGTDFDSEQFNPIFQWCFGMSLYCYLKNLSDFQALGACFILYVLPSFAACVFLKTDFASFSNIDASLNLDEK